MLRFLLLAHVPLRVQQKVVDPRLLDAPGFEAIDTLHYTTWAIALKRPLQDEKSRRSAALEAIAAVQGFSGKNLRQQGLRTLVQVGHLR